MLYQDGIDFQAKCCTQCSVVSRHSGGEKMQNRCIENGKNIFLFNQSLTSLRFINVETSYLAFVIKFYCIIAMSSIN